MLIWPVSFLAQRLFLSFWNLNRTDCCSPSILETELEWSVTTADLLSIIAASY